MRIIVILLFCIMSVMPVMAERNQAQPRNQVKVKIQNQNGHDNHTETDIPLDQPDVYFNSSTMTISIVDYAGCTYDVLVLDSSYNIVHGSLVCGSGSFVLPSSLTSGTYFIEIATSWGNTYVGQLNI